MPQRNNHPDTVLLSLLVKNDKSAWEYLYFKYAPTMYATILVITGNKTIAKEIFEETFLALNDKKILARLYPALCHRLLRLTYQFTLKHLNMRGLKPSNVQPLHENYPLIHLLCFKLSTLKEAAAKLNIPEMEVPKMLRKEYRALCSHSNQNMAAPELMNQGYSRLLEPLSLPFCTN